MTKERRGRKAALAKYVQKKLKLRAKYKGKVYKAYVSRDGIIVFHGRRFYSPSKAGKPIVAKGTAINGWHFWEYERAHGDWVRLNELRR